jgi:DNA/RNA-binding domain of Phe-tRNA-synthetase-like protein
MSELQRGWCEREVEEELPGLCAISLPVRPAIAGALDGKPPRAVAARLRQLADRWRGARAINVRQEPVPAAYRVFFRHIGLDPDIVRTPIEALVLERMVDGGFLSKGALADVLTVAVMDTGVPVWALDGDTLDGPLGVRLSRPGERLGEAPDAVGLAPERLVLADSKRPLAVLFGEIAPGHEPHAATRNLSLFSIQVPGVPLLHVEEALWMARTLLEGT